MRIVEGELPHSRALRSLKNRSQEAFVISSMRNFQISIGIVAQSGNRPCLRTIFRAIARD
jgi:hypothetical protein